MSIPISQFIPSPSSPIDIHVCSLCLSLFLFYNKVIYTNFFRTHMCVLIYDTYFSLSD